MRVLYLEPFSGISGDMWLGALADLGVPVSLFSEQIAALGLSDRIIINARSEQRAGVAGTKVYVLVDGREEGPAEVAGAGPDHGTLPEQILSRIGGAPLVPEVKTRSLAVFRRLAEAEGAVHGTQAADVHLHEVGALDALADVVCTVAGVASLNVDRVLSAPPREGHGEVSAAHGRLPVPAPATARLLEGVPVERIDVPFELVTPTGAALLVELCDEFTVTAAMRAERTGYGAGTRHLQGRPNLLRATVGELLEPPVSGSEGVVVLRTSVDDAIPESLPHLLERALSAGALDAWLTPIIMKKGRPGVEITLLAPPVLEQEMKDILFRETGTLGIRVERQERTVLPRTTGVLRTRYGDLRVKCSRPSPEGVWRVHPEYEACREAAIRAGVPLRDVYEAVSRAASEAGNLEVEG